MSGGGDLQQPDMVKPVSAKIIVKTETAHMAPPNMSNIGSPAMGFINMRYESPTHVKVLNAASVTKPGTKIIMMIMIKKNGGFFFFWNYLLHNFYLEAISNSKNEILIILK